MIIFKDWSLSKFLFSSLLQKTDQERTFRTFDNIFDLLDQSGSACNTEANSVVWSWLVRACHERSNDARCWVLHYTALLESAPGSTRYVDTLIVYRVFCSFPFPVQSRQISAMHTYSQFSINRFSSIFFCFFLLGKELTKTIICATKAPKVYLLFRVIFFIWTQKFEYVETSPRFARLLEETYLVYQQCVLILKFFRETTTFIY